MTKKEFSYGIIPVREYQGEWQTLLVHHKKGHWALSKGHSEAGESEKQTAARELQEETGLEVEKFLDAAPLTESYTFRSQGTLVQKTNTYFFAKVTGDLKLQPEEIADARWLSLGDACQLATFPEAKNLLGTVFVVLKSLF